MRSYELGHFSTPELVQEGRLTAKRERGETAMLLAIIAEIDARGVYVPAGYSSLFTFCVREFQLSEDAANSRIQAARAARRFSFLFEALDDGRLSLTSIRLIAPHLTPENARDLVASVSGRSMTDIQRLIAQRFPCEQAPRTKQLVRAIPSQSVGVPVSRRADPLFGDLKESSAPSEVPASAANGAGHASPGHPPAHAPAHAPTVRVEPNSDRSPQSPAPSALSVPRHPTFPMAPERYLVRFTVARSTHDKLRYAQMLASHSNPGGSIERIVDEALDLFIEYKEKQKFARTNRPRPRERSVTSAAPRPAPNPAPPPVPNPAPRPVPNRRHIPAEVRRAVWKRDQGQCTFVSSDGRRCESRSFLEFDHIDPVARGGKTTVERLRLRCRTHNQYEAEQSFGTEFMRAKREGARLARGHQEFARGGPELHSPQAPDAKTPPG